jgi:multidrug efflux system membrane fusion protein
VFYSQSRRINSQNKLTSGTLTTVDNQIDQTTGTVRIRATFDNKNNSLFPNQFVNARLLVEEKKNVVLLSSAAIQRTSSTTFVYLVKPDGTVTIRNITVGTTEGDDAQITSGLVEGDVVVQTGADKLQEASHVNAQIAGAQSGAASPSGTTGPSGTSPSGTKRAPGGAKK